MATLYENHNTGEDLAYSIGSEAFGNATWRCMTFTPTVAHQISSVKLKLYRTGSPGTLTVSIRATTSSLPSGSDLTSGTTDADTLTTDTAGEWREITFSSPVSLTASTMYAIVCRVANAGINLYGHWLTDTNDGYSGGQGNSSNNSGSTWGTQNINDCMFEDWGTSAFIPRIFYF